MPARELVLEQRAWFEAQPLSPYEVVQRFSAREGIALAPGDHPVMEKERPETKSALAAKLRQARGNRELERGIPQKRYERVCKALEYPKLRLRKLLAEDADRLG